jgi:hypothetical protein
VQKSQNKCLNFKSAGELPGIPRQFSRYLASKRPYSCQRLPKWHLISGEDIAPPKLVFRMNFESSLILGSFFFIVTVKLLLKDYLEDLGVICLFLQILYLGWYY